MSIKIIKTFYKAVLSSDKQTIYKGNGPDSEKLYIGAFNKVHLSLDYLLDSIDLHFFDNEETLHIYRGFVDIDTELFNTVKLISIIIKESLLVEPFLELKKKEIKKIEQESLKPIKIEESDFDEFIEDYWGFK